MSHHHGMHVLSQARADIQCWGAVATVPWRALLQVIEIASEAATQHRNRLREVLGLHVQNCL